MPVIALKIIMQPGMVVEDLPSWSIMIEINLEKELIDITKKLSGFEKKRNYISLSHISECPRKIINNYKNGYRTNDKMLLKCYKGYQEEKDLKRRIKLLYPDFIETREISVHDGLVKGHTGGELRGILIEIKSIGKDKYLPVNSISTKNYWQIQAYLYFGKYKKCNGVYESRESGLIKVMEIFPNRYYIDKLNDKVDYLVKCVRYNIIPNCECGCCDD